MTVHLVTHDLSLSHTGPYGHPERPDRVSAVIDAIRSSSHDVVEIEAPEVDRELLSTIHDPSYIEHIHSFCISGGGALDADTYAVPASWDAALRAAGAGPAAVDMLRKRKGSGFVAVRPPGHHAEHDRAMGFCLFNNVAITASYLRRSGERVAIVDWDVHHGNGTQHTFYEDPDVLYVSLHEFPFYPGTGWVDEAGDMAGRGSTVNIPLPGGTDPQSYLAAYRRIAVPIVRQFDPDWILVSSGYDAHRLDPLGGLLLESEHYGWMAAALVDIVPKNRLVSFLEGGYDLSALATGAVATVDGATGAYSDLVWPANIDGSAGKTVGLAVESAARYWDLD